jgi:hypothetical protein
MCSSSIRPGYAIARIYGQRPQSDERDTARVACSVSHCAPSASTLVVPDDARLRATLLAGAARQYQQRTPALFRNNVSEPGREPVVLTNNKVIDVTTIPECATL